VDTLKQFDPVQVAPSRSSKASEVWHGPVRYLGTPASEPTGPRPRASTTLQRRPLVGAARANAAKTATSAPTSLFGVALSLSNQANLFERLGESFELGKCVYDGFG
jgi:hypothetical protein